MNTLRKVNTRDKAIFGHLKTFISGLWLCLFFSLILVVIGISVKAQILPAPQQASLGVPTFPWNGTQLPEWNKITFGSMPALKEAGSLSVDRSSVQSLGFDPSRSFPAGTTLDKVFNLGDFQDSFKIQTFNLENISQIVGTNLDSLKLSDFGLSSLQNLTSLVKAVPNLANFPIAQVKPVLDLLKTSLNFQQLQQFNPQQTLGSFLKESPHLGSLSMSSLPLQNYPLKSIPNLEKTPLGTLDKWQAAKISDVPGLKDVPLSKLPGGISPVGTSVGTVDIVFGTKEQNRARTMSGSDVEGFGVPCQKECAHVEFSGSELVRGRQWVSGKYQTVKGGRGILGKVNGGKEPTGRLPFGPAFKVAVWDVSETQGRFTTALFLRFCSRSAFVDLGCTPYYLGPIPWLAYEEKFSDVFLGSVDAVSPSAGGASTPTHAASPSTQKRDGSSTDTDSGNSDTSVAGASKSDTSVAGASKSDTSVAGTSKSDTSRVGTSNSDTSRASNSDTSRASNSDTSRASNSDTPANSSGVGAPYQGISLDALGSSMQGIEGNFNSVGTHTCDGTGNCGSGLGAYGLMSYRPDVRFAISSRPGGSEVLSKLDKGEAVTPDRLSEVFPSEAQKEVFEAIAKRSIDSALSQTDPQTSQPFSGQRAIERIGQMQYGGPAIPVDSPASDIRGYYSVFGYGKKVAESYQSFSKVR
ncbi:MAG: hypothetical protein JGK30_14665 [Microcoleus sp. PH2017_40_RAT_O_B]|uniref:hypothetical protein n=1 Tax=unclassified Microcoleus TaxID=2642155 RepID=UPI001DDD0B8E|nr:MULTISPECIES: hypothetical protein [unclassified Microcoleus]MCC3573352.1 hypothetical protein [Microcoleus sp. PH2017_34_RAT_O_A]MCC3610714.1 hypothetical protein [Microcoleus sp. PH2017_40_RAT_O_B]